MKHTVIRPASAWTTALACIWIGLLGTARLGACPGFVESVEWMVCASDTVAVGTFKEIKPEKGTNGVIDEHCVFNIKEMIKGKPDKEITFVYRHSAEARKDWQPGPGEEVLVFLSTRKEYRVERQTTWIARATCANDVPDKDMRLIPNREKLLSICRQWAASPIRNAIIDEIEANSKLFRHFHIGNLLYLEVPADEAHRQRFLKFAKSNDSDHRLKAAQELWKFPDDESEAALRSLLDDTTERIWPAGKEGISRIEYSVRSAAYRGLKQLGKPMPRPLLDRPPSAEESRKHRHKAWQQSITPGLQFGWKVAAMHDGDDMQEGLHASTIVEADLVNDAEKCTLRVVPEEFGKQQNEKMEYLGFSRQEKCHFYATPSMPPSLRIVLTSHFLLTVQN